MKTLIRTTVAAAALALVAGCSKPPAADDATAQSPAVNTGPPVIAATATELNVPDGAMTVSLNVEGMHCASCEGSIVEELKKLDGVYDVKASFAESDTEVSYDPEKAKPEQFVAAISELQYTATLPGVELPETAGEDAEHAAH